VANERTLRDLLTTQARRFERWVFLEYGGQQFSYGAVDERTDRVATGLNRLGLRPGDRMALLMRNRPEYIFFLLGAPKIGAISVPLDLSFSREELLSVLNHSGASAVVTESRFRELRSLAPDVRHWIEVDSPSFAESPFNSLTRGPILGFWPDLDPEDSALISYSRMNSGSWKAVVLSHGNLISNCAQMGQPFRINETDRFLCVIPLSTTLAFVLLVLVPWAAGAACILKEAFSQQILQDIRERRATVIAGNPGLYELVGGLPDFLQSDLSSLRLALCSSGPVGGKALVQFEERHDALIVEGYGPAEGTCLCCANPYTGVRKPGSLGLPLPGLECRVVDPDGQELPAGKVGEIVIRGPNVMKGYYRDPAGTARAQRDGWLRTGDFGRADSDGYYYLESRDSSRF
jgi:long-chain acyl-CoA synthetase